MQCQNTKCTQNSTVSIEEKTGFPSLKDENIVICKTCRAKEKIEEQEEEEEYEVGSTSGLNLAASVVYNTMDASFQFNDEFYEHVKLADEERMKFEQSYHGIGEQVH